MEYLTPEDPKPGRLHLLPKIHKENNPPMVVIMGNVRVKGSYIHGNKRGIFWNG
jgi:hypothetical protein